MISRPPAAAILFVMLLALPACGGEPPPLLERVVETRPDADESTRISPTPDRWNPGDEESPLARRAISFLADELSVPEAQIEILSVDMVKWPDGSWVCGEEESSNGEELTEGREIRLEFQGQVFILHSDLDGNIAPCFEAEELGPPPSNIDPIFKDGNPNQPRDDDVIIRTPSNYK